MSLFISLSFYSISILNSSHRPASLLSTQLLRFPDDHSLSSVLLHDNQQSLPLIPPCPVVFPFTSYFPALQCYAFTTPPFARVDPGPAFSFFSHAAQPSLSFDRFRALVISSLLLLLPFSFFFRLLEFLSTRPRN